MKKTSQRPINEASGNAPPPYVTGFMFGKAPDSMLVAERRKRERRDSSQDKHNGAFGQEGRRGSHAAWDGARAIEGRARDLLSPLLEQPFSPLHVSGIQSLSRRLSKIPYRVHPATGHRLGYLEEFFFLSSNVNY